MTSGSDTKTWSTRLDSISNSTIPGQVPQVNTSPRVDYVEPPRSDSHSDSIVILNTTAAVVGLYQQQHLSRSHPGEEGHEDDGDGAEEGPEPGGGVVILNDRVDTTTTTTTTAVQPPLLLLLLLLMRWWWWWWWWWR